MLEVGGGGTRVSQMQVCIRPRHKVLTVVWVKTDGSGEERQGSSILSVVKSILHCSVAVERVDSHSQS